MSFEEALIIRVADAPIGAMLGRWQGTRAVHWGDRPEGAPLPAIVFTMIDLGIAYTHGGRDPLRIGQIQADSMAQDYATAKMIAEGLGRLLEEAADIGGVAFDCGFIDLERDIPVIGVRGAPSVYGRTQRFSIYHKE